MNEGSTIVMCCVFQTIVTILAVSIAASLVVKAIKAYIACILRKGEYTTCSEEGPFVETRSDQECMALYDKLEQLVKDAVSLRVQRIERVVDYIQSELDAHRKTERQPDGGPEVKAVEDRGFQHVVCVPDGLEGVFLKEDWPVGTRCLYKGRVAVLVEDKKKDGCGNTGCVFRQNGTCICNERCMPSNRADGKLVYWKFVDARPDGPVEGHEDISTLPVLKDNDDIQIFLSREYPTGKRCIWKGHVIELVQDKGSQVGCKDCGCVFWDGKTCIGRCKACGQAKRMDRTTVHWECVEYQIPASDAKPAEQKHPQASGREEQHPEQQESEAFIL